MNPHALAERRVELSAEYSSASEMIGKLKAQKAVQWLQARAISKTDKEATMRLEASPEGQQELILVYKCKGLEKEISAINSMLRVLDGESRNLQ